MHQGELRDGAASGYVDAKWHLAKSLNLNKNALNCFLPIVPSFTRYGTPARMKMRTNLVLAVFMSAKLVP